MAEKEGRGLLATTGLLVVALLALCPGVLSGRTLFLRDLAVFHRPLRRVLLDLLARSDGLPAWNPLSQFGQPFAANPNSGVFDPWSALFLVLPFDLAFNLQVLLPLLLGALGFACLVKERGGSSFAAAFGALSWGLGGCALSVSGYLQFHHAIAVLPLVLTLTLRLLRSPSLRATAWLGIAIGLQGLAGSPTGLMLTALLLPFAAWDGWSRQARSSGRRVILGLLLAGGLGAAIGAATWFPAATLLPETGRVADEAFGEEAQGWSLPPVRLLELAAPRLFGHVVPETVGFYWGRGLYGWRQWPYLFSLYGGLAALVLAVPVVLALRREDRPWILVGVLGSFLAFGAHLPGWSLLLRVVPLLEVVRFPEKWAVAPALVLALLAASGLDLVLRDVRAARSSRRIALGLAVALASLTATLWLGDEQLWPKLWSIPNWLASTTAAIAKRDFAQQFLVAGLLAALFFVRRRRELVLPLALIGLTATELVIAGRQLMPTDEVSRFDEPPAVLVPLLAAPEGERTLFLYADWKHFELREDGKQVLLEAPVPWQWGIGTALEKDFDGTQLAWSRSSTRDLLRLMAERPDQVSEVLRRRGVAAVLGPSPQGAAGRLELLAVKDPSPFVFTAESVMRRGVGESLSEASVRAGPALVFEPDAVLPAVPAPAELRVLERAPALLRLQLRSAGESVVAVNGSWHRDWRTAIDGRPAELLRRDGHLSAVVVPAGEHEIRLQFRSRPLVVGLWMSVLGLLAAFSLVVWDRRRFAGMSAEAMASSGPSEPRDRAAP